MARMPTRGERPRTRISWLSWVAGAAACCSCSVGWDLPLPNPLECEVDDAFPEDGLVRVDACGRFNLRRQPLVPCGVNSYPLLQHAGEGNVAAMREIFEGAARLGRNVVRTNAFFEGRNGDSRHPARLRDERGGLREEGLRALDLVLELAEQYGVKLVLVLANHWSDYGGAPAVVDQTAPGEGLPVEAFYADRRLIDAQERYVAAIVQRINSRTGRPYAADETVFAWELVNEARCDAPAFCGEHTLVEWARAMANAIRRGGAVQLIAWGGAGYVNEHGENLEAFVHEPALDVLTLHYYPEPVLRVASRDDGIAHATVAAIEAIDRSREFIDRVRSARRASIFEEVGYHPQWAPNADAERALFFEDLGSWASRAGFGVFPWMIGERDRPDYDGYLIRLGVDEATAGSLGCRGELGAP